MMSRARIVITHALIAGALAATASAASAQTYPSQPIRMIVPFTAGSPNDVVARLLAQQLTIRLGQNVIIDNRPGAGTNAGTKAAASAEPNGYTLLFNSSSMVVSPAMYRNPGYDPQKNFVPVANAVFGHWVTVIEKSIPANTVPEFIAYAKKNPGKLAFGYGQGTAPQLVGEWLKVREGIDITSVPYKGGRAGDHRHDRRAHPPQHRHHRDDRCRTSRTAASRRSRSGVRSAIRTCRTCRP